MRKRRPSRQTLAVLQAMLQDPTGMHYGLELSKQCGLASGTIYPLLNRLEDDGLVVSDWEQIDPKQEGRPRKRFYQLTGAGATAARQYLEQQGSSGFSLSNQGPVTSPAIGGTG